MNSASFIVQRHSASLNLCELEQLGTDHQILGFGHAYVDAQPNFLLFFVRNELDHPAVTSEPSMSDTVRVGFPRYFRTISSTFAASD